MREPLLLYPSSHPRPSVSGEAAADFKLREDASDGAAILDSDFVAKSAWF